MKSYETQTVGQIVADKYEAANVFEKYGIDYCCHGSTPLLEACKNANVELDQTLHRLLTETSILPIGLSICS